MLPPPPAKPTSASPFQRYALTFIGALVTVAAELLLGTRSPLAISLLVSLLAIVLTAYFAGRGAALCATAANLLAIWYLFATPRFSFAITDPRDRWQLVIFAAGGVGFSLLTARLSGTRHLSRVVMVLASTLLLVIVAVLVWVDLENQRAAEGWVEHTYQVLNAADDLLGVVDDAEEKQRDYLLTGDERYVLAFSQSRSTAAAAEGKLQSLTRDNDVQQARIREIRGLIDSRLQRLMQGITVRREQGLEAATAEVAPGIGARQMDRLRGLLSAIESEEHRLLAQRTNDAAEQAGRTRTALTLGTTLLVVLLIAAGITIEADVKKIQGAAAMLRRQAELLDKAQSPIVVWELGGQIEYWNHGAELLYGISREKAIGHNHDELLRPIGIAAIERLLERDSQWSGELSYCVNGREIIVESEMKLTTEVDGRKFVLKTNRDVTEERRARAEIRQMNRELEQRVKDRTAQLEASNKELEAFAYAVSHDLRAPLRGINGWSMALLEDYGPTLDQTAREYLERVRADTRRMGRLIDDLLALSRVTRTPLQRESVDLTALARTIASRLHEAEPKRGMEFLIQDGL
ncbi:MAG TPA: CHASE3 domain-containing protein, partial [Bryobacteraceae bacterium]|nr:CHASE3 domain-containing protein [Bryobacteraceae bacterium]